MTLYATILLVFSLALINEGKVNIHALTFPFMFGFFYICSVIIDFCDNKNLLTTEERNYLSVLAKKEWLLTNIICYGIMYQLENCKVSPTIDKDKYRIGKLTKLPKELEDELKDTILMMIESHAIPSVKRTPLKDIKKQIEEIMLKISEFSRKNDTAEDHATFVQFIKDRKVFISTIHLNLIGDEEKPDEHI